MHKFVPGMLVAVVDKLALKKDEVEVIYVLRVKSVNDRHVRTSCGTFRRATGQSVDKHYSYRYLEPLTRDLAEKAEHQAVKIRAEVLCMSRAEVRHDQDASYEAAKKLSKKLGRPLQLHEVPGVYVVEIGDEKLQEFSNSKEAQIYADGYNRAVRLS